MNNCKRTSRLLLLLTTLFFLPVSLVSQVEVYTSIDTTRGLIGDLFHLHVKTEHPSDYVVRYPDTLKTLGEFTIRDLSVHTKRTATTATYTLAVYDTGEYTIPPVSVTVFKPSEDESPLRIQSSEIHIAILSIVPPDAQELKDIKPLMRIPPKIRWMVILGILGAAIIAAVLWRKMRAARENEGAEMTPAERRRSAHEIALKRLREIRRANYPARGAFKLHFSEVSETVRQYFEDRYFIPALEMTTTEVMRELPAYVSDDAIGQKIEALLSLSDLVKFAKYQPSAAEAEEVLSHAFDVVELTKIAAESDTEDYIPNEIFQNTTVEDTHLSTRKEGEEL